MTYLMRSCFLLACGIVASPAVASPATAPFVTSPVSDRMLAYSTGMFAPSASLTVGNLNKMVESQTRNDFRVTAAVGRTQMDVWWGTIGSELIANAVRR